MYKTFEGEGGGMGNSTTTRTTTAQLALDMMAAIRFHPTNKEMTDFLGKKMRSHKSQACHFLPVIDVYKSEPRALPELMFADSAFQAKAWYTFSLCDYKYTNSLRCNRVTKHGFWKITGKPQDFSSKYFTCKKRTLTFQTKTFKGGASKSVRTGWIMHEYYCSKPKQGSSPCQERDVKRDYVLCLLKYKPVDSKSDKKKPEGTSVCDDLADLGNCGYIASSPGDDHAASAAAMIHMTPDTEVLTYKELEDDLLGNGNHDHGKPGGGVSSDSIDQALRDMIHESHALLGGYQDSPFPPPETPQLHQPPHLGNAPDICSHELLDPGIGGCITYNTNNQAAAMNHMIPVTEEILAHKQLDSCVFGSGDHDVGELGSSISSDFNDPAVDDMILDVSMNTRFKHSDVNLCCSQLGKELDSPLSPPEPHQPHRPHQLGNVPDIHSSKFSHWTSPIGDNDWYVTNTNNIATNYDNEPVMNIAYNSKNHATNEWISEVYSQAEENWGSTFQPFDQLQNYRLQSPILFSKPGELLHANNYIGCIELQSLAMEIATLSPQSS
ncbi:NAC transcription factor NAM-B1-like [Pyrus x bretschneideri]|uniref:NAC transcription factor NAM-B1-like n=1 Tax=Pyrus x bretschneideri TaxID=225117 RepID=UPI00202FF0BF|nr:NAC transcription factor NAM-B1-like [Pyrus x bretschneideri]